MWFLIHIMISAGDKPLWKLGHVWEIVFLWSGSIYCRNPKLKSKSKSGLRYINSTMIDYFLNKTSDLSSLAGGRFASTEMISPRWGKYAQNYQRWTYQSSKELPFCYIRGTFIIRWNWGLMTRWKIVWLNISICELHIMYCFIVGWHPLMFRSKCKKVYAAGDWNDIYAIEAILFDTIYWTVYIPR